MSKPEKQYFIWEGINNRGLRVKGELICSNSHLLQIELRKQGIEPIKVRRKPTCYFKLKKPIKISDIVLFSRYLATLIGANIPLVQALDIIAKGQNKISTRSLFIEIRNDVTAGKTFNDSLAKHPQFFNNLFVSLIKVGETSGTLATILAQLADHLEKTNLLKNRVQKALYYPICIIVISLIITSVLLIFILPQFEILFKSFGSDLPFFTREVINFASFFQTYKFFIYALLILASISFYYAFKYHKKFRNVIDSLIFKIPVIGKVIQKSIIARVTRTLATTLTAGVPILDALNIVSTVANNYLYTRSILKIRESIGIGESMHAAVNLPKLFPRLVVQMIAVGEESGTLDIMLGKIAKLYEEEIENRVDGLSTLVEPILMVILGLIIGSFVLAMYLPIFKLGLAI